MNKDAHYYESLISSVQTKQEILAYELVKQVARGNEKVDPSIIEGCTVDELNALQEELGKMKFSLDNVGTATNPSFIVKHLNDWGS